MSEVVMPKLSDSMEEGTIISWLKQHGERVEVGDDLLEIETDKATMTQPAGAAGVLEIVVAEGSTVPVGEVLARIGASAPVAESQTPAGSSGVVIPASADLPVEVGAVAAAATAATTNGAERPRATPLARRIAAAHGVALEDLNGTGPLGRITRIDVLRGAGIEDAPAEVRPVAPRERPAEVSVTRTTRQLSRLQQRIARRMSEAKATIPHFQVQTEVTMDAAIALRGELKRVAGEGDTAPSVNDMIVKAAALALRDHPLANGSYKDGGFELHGDINVGIAVAADGALVVPTLLGVDSKALTQIARETRELAARVRSGEITPPELSGGTFTVSNLGMFGMTAITPVINPPQAAILGVGAARETLARECGEIVDRTLLTLTLSCDHRILYGADAARFLARIRELLEEPLKLLV